MQSQSRQKLVEFFQSKWGIILMSVVTLYSLFGDDIRGALLPPSSDIPFTIVTIVSMIIFSFQIIVFSLLKPNYFLSFNFGIDIVSTAMITFDIYWVSNIVFTFGNIIKATQISKASRAVRLGSRICRLLRIIRLVRIMKLFAQAQQRILKNKSNNVVHKKESRVQDMFLRQRRKKSRRATSNFQLVHHRLPSLTIQNSPEVTVAQDNKETKLGNLINDSTQKRLIILVILIISIIPVLQAESYITNRNGQQAGLDELLYWNETSHNLGRIRTLFRQFIYRNQKDYFIVQSSFAFNSTFNFSFPDSFQFPQLQPPLLSDLRQTDYQSFQREGALAVFSLVLQNKWTSIFNIIKTLITCFVLVMSSYFFSIDIQFFVLQPLQGMVRTVSLISQNPLQAQNQEAIKKFLREDDVQQQSKYMRKLKEEFQTSKLEDLVIRIGVLLKIGFGEAGSRIVAENLKDTKELNPLVPGRKVNGIFGFCSIRNFSDSTDLLQSQVMKFVNKVAKIVHYNVQQYGGSPNKNIGEAFLVVWKVQQDQAMTEQQEKLALRQTADLALYGFVKTIAQINSSIQLQEYREHEGLNSRIHNYEVRLGFGLHYGWAIQGSIGSFFKIDASYLSPNVNMASRLQAATKQFGIDFLMSGEFVALLTPQIRVMLRQIDCVTVKGSKEPVSLFTIDLDMKSLPIRKRVQREENKLVWISQKKALKRKIKAKPFTLQLFQRDPEIQLMRSPFQRQIPCWNLAFEHYLKGEFSVAERLLLELQEVWRRDGPREVLLKFMRERREEWRGYRVLKSK